MTDFYWLMLLSNISKDCILLTTFLEPFVVGSANINFGNVKNKHVRISLE